MKKIMLPVLIIFLLTNYASAQERGQFTGKEAKEEIKQYLANPKEDILIVVESKEDTLFSNKINIHNSTGNISNSFESSTPYCLRLQFGNVIAETREQFKRYPPAERQQELLKLKLQNPPTIFIAQSQGQTGIKGKVYYDGREIASSNADIPYGVVTLTIEYPFEKGLLKELQKP